MFIAVTRITAPGAAQERMVEGFRRGGPDLKRFPGFLGFELWRNDTTLEAVSRWESREAMEAYRASPMFGAHHGPGPSAAAGGGAEIVSFDAEVVV
ncbi:MAG: antibiotic biosynthesis monooxygenase [Chloroflexi bacterium]|nr:antibiotic biosynthesis monooxygenase [Chloroflexota bacterium]